MDNYSKLMEQNTFGVSVIICCYNSSLKLPQTLAHLAVQENPQKIPFEIILVNNNSTDDTVEMADIYWKSVNSPFPMFIFDEQKSGLNNARLKGVEKAKYEYVIFCDDDNSLCNNYLTTVVSIFKKVNNVFMIGGVGEATLNTVVPKWFNSIGGFGFAVGKEGRKTGYTNSIYGAGMAIRKSVFKYLQNENIKFILTDRVGKTLSSGGDTELCTLVNCSKGKIWFDDSLTFKHHLEKQRISWPYYLRLRASFGIANAFLNLYSESYSQPNSIKAFKNLIKFVLRYPHLIILANWSKHAKFANAIQQYNFLKTIYCQRTKIKSLKSVVKTNKQYMQMLDSQI